MKKKTLKEMLEEYIVVDDDLVEQILKDMKPEEYIAMILLEQVFSRYGEEDIDAQTKKKE